MQCFLSKWIGACAALAVLASGFGLSGVAEPVPVRHAAGTIHGFLALRSEDGALLASGDLIQVAHGGQVQVETVFHFKDGSLDDETADFSQRGSFRLIRDRHIQKGPAFPHPIDIAIDCPGGRVTVRSQGKDGRQEVKTDRLSLPPDLANGMIAQVLENLPAGSGEVTVSMLVATPKPRIVKLAIAARGEQSFSVFGSPRQAIHDEIKVELGGVAGVVAPLIGKQPANIEAWVTGGPAPTLIREQGPIYPEGPILEIEMASPIWPKSAKAGE